MASFFDVFRDKVEDWIDNFCCDLDYEHEILYWELVGAFYLSWLRERRYSRTEKGMILRILMELIQGSSSDKLDTLLGKIPEHIRRPFSKKIDEWNADLNLVQDYSIRDLAEHPNITSLFMTRLQARKAE